MNRILLFLCCICVSWMARGQVAYEWRYWFDMDHATGRTGQAMGDHFTIETNANGLSDGFHTIHVQVADTAGRFSPPLAQLFFHTADRTIEQLYYWFDDESVLSRSVPTFQDNLSIDVSSLAPGLHFIYCLAIDAAGNKSDVLCRAFYRQPFHSDLRWSYWFDEDESPRAVVPFPNEVVLIDVSGLEEGFHVFHSQKLDGIASDITSTMFIKIPQTENAGEMTCICTVDGMLVAEEKLSAAGGFLRWNMDVSKMDVGIHKAMFQIVTPSGAGSTIAERYFVRAITNKEMGSMKCLYTIDNFETYHQAGRLSDGLFHFDLDVASIENGLHRIAYTLVSETGVTLPQQTAFFWKTPLGGEGIMQYDYWLNDRDDQKHSVQLPERINPFNLITLLPVETQPIRSSNFKFAVKNGSPLIYARNNFHIQFFDTNGRMAEESKEYVDEQVSASVVPVGELQATQTFEKVAENDVRWYTVQVAPGDTAAFRLSQPATIQLFAPNGTEVFKTSESASVKWSGIHTWEDGTYYLAIHDVTGSKENMTLEYMHMDKYDVVDWDVHTVGNGGCSTITFKGNGFRDLYAVDLVIAPGDTVHSVYVSHDSDAETAIAFDFTGATLGDYNAVFHFTEEDKPVANVVTVEEAKDIELATTVTYPSTFLRGTSTTYTIKITNKGNTTSYRTPIYIYIASNTPNGISRVNISGLQLEGIFDGINMDSLSVSERNELKAIADEIGETHYFINLSKYDETIGDSLYVMSGNFFTDIAPLSTKTINVTITTLSQIELWCSVPSANNPLSAGGLYDNTTSRRRITREEYCCIREKIECLVNLVATGIGLANKLASFAPGSPWSELIGIADCVADAVSTVVTAAGEVYCDNPNYVEMTLWEKVKALKDGISICRVIAKCAEDLMPVGKLKEFLKAIKGITGGDFFTALGVYETGFNCATALTEKKTNCPPNSDGGGGISNSVNSHEPNEIYGYVAESGSRAIKEGKTDVFYTIQFENDTVFATAPAHDVYLTDTLDVNLFDLSTYRPTRITIGNKSMELTGERNFISTLDMRPEINAIAQIHGTIDDNTGIVRWHISSLDPMTMEPSDDPMVGVLPVNFDGSGLGEASFEISLKPNLPDGTIIPNRSGNVFDNNETVLTPTWTNIVDAVAPSSVIDNSWMVNDSTLRVTADAFDARSGVWKYEWYVQAGENAPWWKEGETEGPQFDYHIFEGIDYGFCVLATDSAGNVEQKVIQRERSFKTYGQDYEDGIDSLTPDPSPVGEESWYDLSGRKLAVPRRGINVIDDKKVLVK